MNLITASYRDDLSVSFTEDGWINATALAASFGKRIDHYLANAETKEYIGALCDEEGNTRNVGDFLKTRRGRNGGTWIHPDLGVHFARWLDVRFAIWCDRQIKAILTGRHPAFDWKRSRHEAASSHKVMSGVLQQIRERQGKTTAPHHYSNEARLVNWVLTGEFRGLDRNSLTQADLNLLAALEERNAVLIGCGLSYDARKHDLLQFAQERRPALTVH